MLFRVEGKLAQDLMVTERRDPRRARSSARPWAQTANCSRISLRQARALLQADNLQRKRAGCRSALCPALSPRKRLTPRPTPLRLRSLAPGTHVYLPYLQNDANDERSSRRHERTRNLIPRRVFAAAFRARAFSHTRDMLAGLFFSRCFYHSAYPAGRAALFPETPRMHAILCPPNEICWYIASRRPDSIGITARANPRRRPTAPSRPSAASFHIR